MSFFFGDSFDCYALPADALLGYWDSGATSSWTLGAGRFSGSRCLQFNTQAAVYLAKSSGSNDATHHIVCAYQQTATLSGSTLGLYFQLTDGTTNQCCIVFRSDGVILLTSATPNGTILATYTGAVTATSTWYAFEFEVVINNTTGAFAVRKNGNTSNDFNATSLNTRPGTNSYANKLSVGSFNSVNLQMIDDLLWRSDAASVPWVGDIRCYTRRPEADASVAWSPSGGSSLSQSIGAVTTTNVDTSVMRTAPFTTYSGTITAASVGIAANGGGSVKCAIYANNSGVPGVVLATADAAVAAPSAGSVNFTFTPGLTVSAGTVIWLAFQHSKTSPSTTISFNHNTSAPYSTQGLLIASTYSTFPLPNPAPVTTGQTCLNCSITYSSLAGNAGCVSEQQQDAAASYVYSSAPGAQDLYTLTGISSTPSTIVGTTTRGLLTKSDAGTRLAAVQLRSGSTTVQAAGALSSSAWGWLWRTDQTDPATGTAWTVSGVAAAQIGAQVTG